MTTLVALASKDALVMGTDSLGTVTRGLVDPLDLLEFFDVDNGFKLKVNDQGEPLPRQSFNRHGTSPVRSV